MAGGLPLPVSRPPKIVRATKFPPNLSGELWAGNGLRSVATSASHKKDDDVAAMHRQAVLQWRQRGCEKNYTCVGSVIVSTTIPSTKMILKDVTWLNYGYLTMIFQLQNSW